MIAFSKSGAAALVLDLISPALFCSFSYCQLGCLPRLAPLIAAGGRELFSHSFGSSPCTVTIITQLSRIGLSIWFGKLHQRGSRK